MGMGWGNLGQIANVSNPFSNLKESFDNRNNLSEQGGTFNYKDWFSGQKAAVFGGLEYKFKKYGLRLKLEYDTSKPDSSYGSRLPVEVHSRFNVGLTYNVSNFADLGLSFERGNQVRFNFIFRGNFLESSLKKSNSPIKLQNKDLDHTSQDFLVLTLNELKKRTYSFKELPQKKIQLTSL